MDPEALIRLLAQSGWVEPEDSDRLLEDYESGAVREGLFDFLEASGVGSKQEVLRVVAEARGVEFVDLNDVEFPSRLLDSVPQDLRRIYRCIPIYDSTDSLKICLSDPLDDVAVDELRNLLGRRVDIAIADPDLVDALLERSLSGPMEQTSTITAPSTDLLTASTGTGEPAREPSPAPRSSSGGWLYASALLALAAAVTSATYLKQRDTLKTASALVGEFESLQEQTDLEQLATERITIELGQRLEEIERGLDRVSADAIRIAQVATELRRLEGRLQTFEEIVPGSDIETPQADPQASNSAD
jgi:hypothetical protein